MDFAEQGHAWLTEIGVMRAQEDGDSGLVSSLREMSGQALNWGITAVGAITALIILVVMTGFLSANPDLYLTGAIRLVPSAKRDVAQHTLSALAAALRWWFLGQLVSMAILGVTVGIGLFSSAWKSGWASRS